jgi:hypothetical protein
MTDTLFLYKKIIEKAWRTSLVLLFVFMISLQARAQTQEVELNDTAVYDDSYKEDSAYQNPRKAAILSAILPGMGQVYNKKTWKVPIVYAGFGTLVYFIRFNQNGYEKWKLAYIDIQEDGVLDMDLGYDFPLTIEQVDRTKNSYKRYRDLSIIGTAGFYILQIIDATVDAYLFDWDVSEDISLKIEPTIIQTPSFFISPSENAFALRASISF